MKLTPLFVPFPKHSTLFFFTGPTAQVVFGIAKQPNMCPDFLKVEQAPTQRETGDCYALQVAANACHLFLVFKGLNKEQH